MKRAFIDFLNDPGIITLLNWTVFPDGEEYKYVWSEEWKIVTDKEFPLENFRSSERWQVLAINQGNVLAVIPGCQVVGWVRCKAAPVQKRVYRFEGVF